MRDWLFGVNPWGKCMIVALPEDGDYPRDPHSPIWDKGGHRLDGGVVDGPVEYYNLQGVRVMNPSKGLYIKKQGDKATKVVL